MSHTSLCTKTQLRLNCLSLLLQIVNCLLTSILKKRSENYKTVQGFDAWPGFKN